MRLVCLILAAILLGGPAFAQETPPSSAGAAASSEVDEKGLPVSLDRIREDLAKPSPVLGTLWANPDFRTEIQERVRIEEILSTLDYKAGPIPPGGVYGYEQQERVFNKVDHPLMQPYAAFSGGELLTIAIENLAAKYLAGRALQAVSNAQRTAAENAARAEVAAAIANYCDGRPDRFEIRICTDKELQEQEAGR